MNPKRKQRLMVVLFLLAGAGATVALTLLALNENLNLFYPPDQIVSGEAPTQTRIRAGGMVMAGSVARQANGLDVSFVLTDYEGSDFEVRYSGILPDLFREGQGILVQGQLGSDGVFKADEVLAKHDENYMPPELADMHRPAAPGGDAE
ncbi:MAG: cytochrome c maturation protein CcmE [Gammaproteobacteria bacterium]|nr:cytochrome c maturation protein CcmE [Gammaproteobacteria bacterium]|tara:strand:- start:3254 stop:3700 length:447 start_codon:yes stop_codon:yes gene_type:complete